LFGWKETHRRLEWRHKKSMSILLSSWLCMVYADSRPV
jgi:hypothetical protein